MATATFGAGCFWGVEETFRQLEGVTETAVGYAGGHQDNPTYKQVCTDSTGHAEVVQVKYDAEKIAYEKLLEVFFKNHNPTTPNRQGPDYGSQYRSVIFTHDEQQDVEAHAFKKQLEEKGVYSRPIVTEIQPAPTFYMAEEYHQQYLAKRGQSSCHLP